MEEVFDLAKKALEEQKEGKWVNVTEAWMMEDLENQIKEGKGCLGREEEVKIRLKSLPPVNPQPKTGHWIFDEILDKHYYCSECKSMGVDYWDYCPNCGAKMESEND